MAETKPLEKKRTLLEGNIQALFSPLENREQMQEAPEIPHILARQSKKHGGNARCKAMLEDFLPFIENSQFPDTIAAHLFLSERIDYFRGYLSRGRPLTFGMKTAFQYLKQEISKIPLDTPEKNIKQWLRNKITSFIKEKIELPMSIIAGKGAALVADNDNILIYGGSSAVIASLLVAKEAGKNFRVTIADSRPGNEGKNALKVLSEVGIHCTYILISTLSYHMADLTRVFIGASGITSNGYLQNTAGTALVCCVSHSFKKPVLVFSETYKFSEDVLIDVFSNNELGNPDDLVNLEMYPGDHKPESCIQNWREMPNLHLLNVKYDLTPPQYIDMLVTETGCIPVTSVPVILREISKEDPAASQIENELLED